MHRAIEDALAFSWTLRRKPLESFMAPAAAPGGDTLLCRDGSLVSLFRLDGARSAMGAEELERFAGLANRRLNNAFLDPGHALHVAFERAPDRAARLLEAATDRQRRRGARLGLDLDDLLDERDRRLAPLLAAETCAAAVWTRPSALTAQQAKRDRKRLRERLEGWLPGAGDAQCPFAVQDGLPPRHAALLDALDALFEEAGLVAERLEDAAALRLMRRLLNGPDSTAPDWRPAGCANDAPPRATEPPEHGAFPPPLAPQLLIREPERRGAGLRIGNRLYGALDMTLGPRAARPFAELMERLAGAGLPCRFSMLVESGGLARMDAAAARAGAAFLAFSHPDSRAVRDAMRELARTRADARAVVRLRLGLLTWTAPEEGEDALADRIGRLQRIAEGWGEGAFSPLVGDPLEAFAASVPGFCCGGTAEPALAPLPEALRLLPAGRPAPLGPRGRPPVPVPRRQDAALLLRRRRRPRVRADLRRPRTRQVGADERPRPGPPPPGRARAPAARRHRRRRPLVLGPDLADPRGAAPGPPRRGRMVPAAHDRRLRRQPLRHPARLPLSAPGRTRLPREPARPDPDPGRGRGRPRRHARTHRPRHRPGLRHALRRGRRRRTQRLHRRTRRGRRRSPGADRLPPPRSAAVVGSRRSPVRRRGGRRRDAAPSATRSPS